MDKIYKVGTPGEGVTLSSCIVRKEFILEAGGMQHGFVGIFRNLRKGIEFEVEVAEFDEASRSLFLKRSATKIRILVKIRLETKHFGN
ncbi:MAG: hypothetical protein ACLU30_09545 [Odoribacter splanchnicus]